MYTSQNGSHVKVSEYQDNDMLKGDMRELNEDGSTKEDGITVADVVMLPAYMKSDEQKQLFDGCKTGDIIIFNPRKAYPEGDVEISSMLKISKEEAANLTADFSYQITEISRYQQHAVDQELFDRMYGPGVVTSEAEFREKIAGELKAQLKSAQDFRFLQDVRAHVEKKLGKIQYADDLMKRIMLANNQDKDQEFVDKNYEASIKELTWHLAKNQLLEAQQIKIEDADVKAVAKETTRMQFAQYGMANVPDEYLEQYAEEMLKKPEQVDGLINAAADRKLMEKLKEVVKLDVKNVSLEEFNKL